MTKITTIYQPPRSFSIGDLAVGSLLRIHPDNDTIYMRIEDYGGSVRVVKLTNGAVIKLYPGCAVFPLPVDTIIKLEVEV